MWKVPDTYVHGSDYCHGSRHQATMSHTFCFSVLRSYVERCISMLQQEPSQPSDSQRRHPHDWTPGQDFVHITATRGAHLCPM